MALILTLTRSQKELVSGIPEYITFETNDPATIFFTLDNSTPDSNSEVYVDKIYLPTNLTSFTLKAIAINLTESSSIFEEDFSVSFVDNTRLTLTAKEGINILKTGSLPVANLAYDVDGNPVKETSIELDELDLVASNTNRIGEKLENGLTIDFINMVERAFIPDSKIRSSTDDRNFDPKAKVILVDGSSEENFNNQLVRLINRPINSMSPLQNRHNYNNYQLTTTSSKYVLNPATGVIVFYYYDSRDNRWIMSKQQIDYKSLNLSKSSVKKFTYEWINFRSQTKIF